jgi:hypothetical protein
MHVEAGRSRYIFETLIEDRPSITTVRSGNSAVAGAGLAWFVRDQIALEALLAYRYNSEAAFNNRNYGSSVGITFGLQFYLFRR